ncbi:hypothetical protein SCOR_16380 [Sulfidibacter corallicola]|uniref:Zinc-finger domain-containing protein n=1 Tax=Sulfidibacter corallicola TaxID=2818388 RepID=A0A8A4TYD6_SULCO|nr:hypothetical protein [Sulfidibacter corallicola]QTD53962.1 hypothetical protein J3U87_16050 [Sulfidibacter corallicola]
MDHEYWEERLQAYLDNELNPADRLAVEQYIEVNPEAKAQLEYFAALKKRLRAHADIVEMPKSLEDRIQRTFDRKRKVRFFRRRLTYVALTIAAAIVLGFLIQGLFTDSNQFVPKTLTGHVVCNDCALAEEAGLTKGSICKDGHRLGLKTAQGELYRFAVDDVGKNFVKDYTLVGNEVEIFGETQEKYHLIRIKNLKKRTQQQASLSRF